LRPLVETQPTTKMTTCNKALKEWETKNEADMTTAKEIKLYCQMPPISKLDNSLNNLSACEKLSLSTNAIDRLIPLGGCPKLKILSIGRNNLKKIEKLDEVSGTLEQLWCSYNNVATLDGVTTLSKLEVLYLSNNNISSWDEVAKLSSLGNLRDILLVGNPIYDELTVEERRIKVLQSIGGKALMKIDGEMVTPGERDAAASA